MKRIHDALGVGPARLVFLGLRLTATPGRPGSAEKANTRAFDFDAKAIVRRLEPRRAGDRFGVITGKASIGQPT